MTRAIVNRSVFGYNRPMDYIAIIDGEPGAYGVVIPDAPGCTAQGETIKDALVAAAESLRDWLEIAHASGSEIPTPRSEEAVRADEDVMADLAAGATIGKVTLVER